MASIQKHRKGWRVQVYVSGVRDSKVLPTRQEASQWALERQAEIGGRKLPGHTLEAALRLYERDVAPTHRGSRWELVRLKSLQADKIAKRKLAGLNSDDLAEWRDARLAQVKPGTVARELNLLRGVLEYVRESPRRWIKVNPLTDVKWPTTPPPRRRRISDAEVDAIAKAFGVHDALRADTATQRTGLAFLFALETAMRSGEVVGLTWDNVHLDARYVVLPVTKNGDRREVPLSKRAVEILRALPEGGGPAFGLGDLTRDALWRKVRPKALADLHFHDSRAEAIWRLSKKLDVLQLARVIGHRNPASLMFYYNETAADMAKRLD